MLVGVQIKSSDGVNLLEEKHLRQIKHIAYIRWCTPLFWSTKLIYYGMADILQNMRFLI